MFSVRTNYSAHCQLLSFGYKQSTEGDKVYW